jgi:hypothetical protein
MTTAASGHGWWTAAAYHPDMTSGVRSFLRRVYRFLLTVLLLVLTSCTWWRRADLTAPRVFQEGERVKVWSRGAMTMMDSVVLRPDSVHGRSERGPVALALADVDSLKVAHPPGVGGVVLGAVGLSIVLFVVGMTLLAGA